MSRLRRLVLFDRHFFVTCNLLRVKSRLAQDDSEILARVIRARRQEHGFLLSAWVFLPHHWHVIVGPRYPKTLSLVLESIKVASTRQINTRRKESGRLWQRRFFDRALRTVKEGPPLSPLLIEEGIQGWSFHWNPVRRGLVRRPEEWKWSSVHEYSGEGTASPPRASELRVDRVRIPAEPHARL